MPQVDEFESMFRSAARSPFEMSPPRVQRVLLVSDLPDPSAYLEAVRTFLEPLRKRCPDAEFALTPPDLRGVEATLRAVEEHQPDLIVSYRNLHSDGWRYAYSLGADLNALTRGTQRPVLITPSPHAHPSMTWRDSRTDQVMAIDETLVEDGSQQDNTLLNWALLLTREQGTLHLVHMEDDATLERYLAAISKIPEINTDAARATLGAQLLKEPRDYMRSVEEALRDEPISIAPHVERGHRVADYARIIDAEAIDLVVLPTLEEDRIALHGASYSLAVELAALPLLMI